MSQVKVLKSFEILTLKESRGKKRKFEILCQEDANLRQQQNVVLSSSSVHLFPPSSSSSSPSSPNSLPSQPLPATAAASKIPKELAGPARTEDGDGDLQGTAHHPCTKEAETFKSTTTPTRPSIIARLPPRSSRCGRKETRETEKTLGRPSIFIRPTCDCLLKLILDDHREENQSDSLFREDVIGKPLHDKKINR